MILKFSLILLSVGLCLGGTTDRSVIVHLFEWKWNDIATECATFLAPYGYKGVQVSPVTANLILPNRPWYERYQPISYNLTTRSGTEDEFRNMVRTCNAVGVRIYVDVLLNHMTGCYENSVGTDGSTGANSCNNNKIYPAIPYNTDNFHTTCSINNYQNATEVRVCELVGLHDLDQSQDYVREKLIGLLNHLVDIGVGGFRVDAAKHMFPHDLAYIYGQVKDLNTEHGFLAGSRPLFYQEVIDMGGEAVKASMYTGLGLVTDFRFGKELSRAFQGNNPLKWLNNFGTAWGLLPSDQSLVFIDNHDNQRGSGGGGDILNYKMSYNYKMAVGFMLAWPQGHPRVMSSFAFTDNNAGPPHYANFSTADVIRNPDLTCSGGWVCEHRWRQIYNMVKFNNIVDGEPVTNWWDNLNNQMAFCRGNKGFAAFNIDSSDLNQNLMTCLPAGQYCDLVSGLVQGDKCTGKTITVDQNGRANIFIGKQEEDGFLALHIEAKLSETCNNLV